MIIECGGRIGQHILRKLSTVVNCTIEQASFVEEALGGGSSQGGGRLNSRVFLSAQPLNTVVAGRNS